MVKFRKIIVATVGIILVIAGILILVVQWFNWDRYRDDIAIWISSLTSQEVSIDGLIEIKLLPSPRVILTGVSVRDSEDELDEQYVHIGSVTARFDLINIFSGDLVLDQLWVNQLQFQVQADRDGQLEKWPRKHSDSPLKFLTPVLIPRRFEMTDSEIEFTDSVSNVVEIIQIQDFTLETLSNQLTSNIKIIASFKGDSLQLEGVIGDLPRWIDGNPAEISVQYKFGDMGGELLGSVGQILDDGLFSLRYSVYGDHFATMANLFKLDLVGIEMGSFISQGKLEGTWDSVSFDEVTGSITGRDFHMDFSGSVLDMFRQNIVQMDLRARSVSFDLLHLFGHEFSSFDGITNINAKLYGESSRSFGLKDVDISSRSSMFEIKATGEVSALGTNPQFKIEFETQTDRLKDFLALLDYEIPIDGSGTADGFLIRDGDNYQIDGLVLSADTPELAFQATGEVSALGTNPQFKIEFETQTDRLKDFLALLDYEIPIDGSGTADGFLIRDGDNYQIDGLVLSADTPELAFQATGEVSALGTNPQFKIEFETQTDRLKDFLALLDYEIPIDGSGTADGFLIRDGDNYQIDGLVLSADTPELAFQATGEVSALGTNPQFKIEFETQTDRLKDFLALLDYEIPIDGSGTADGFLIRDGDNYQIDGLVLSADTPELAFQATGEVSALGQTPEFNLGFKLLNLGEIDLSWFWNEQSLFNLGFLTEVTGSVVAAGGTIVASGLSLDLMGQKLLGHFSGRLPFAWSLESCGLVVTLNQ